MSKIVTAMALAAGGAATYMWLKNNGGTAKLDRQMSGAVDRVRGAFNGDGMTPEAALGERDDVRERMGDFSDRVESGAS